VALKPIQILINAKDNASSVFSSLQTKVAAVGVAIAGYFGIKMFSGAVEAAEALDGQMRKLEAVIQATGGAAGLTAKEIDEMARRLDEATLGSAEGFRDAAGQLLTFKSVGKDAFETTLLLAQDLADTGFGNLKTNVVQLGKALENPVKGLSALGEAGVTFTDKQKDVIKLLVETGRSAEAQGIILEAVAGQVGGTAKAIGGGLSGAVDLVNKRFNDLKEQLGAAVLPVFRRFNELVAETYKRLIDDGTVGRFGEAIAKGFQAALNWARAFLAEVDFNALAGKAASAADQIGETFTKIGEWATNAGNSVKLAYGVMSSGVNVVLTAVYSMGAVWAEIASKIMSGIALLREGLSKVTFGGLSASFKEAAEDARVSAGAFGAVADAMREKATAAMGAVADGAAVARQGWAGLTAEVGKSTTVIDASSKAIASMAEQIEKVGREAAAARQATQAKKEADEAAAAAIKQLQAEYRALIASGDLQAAALKLGEINKALRETPDATKDAAKEVLALAGALKELGITSDADLKRAADSTRKLYEEVRNAGGSAREQAEAFQKMAEAAIASGDGAALSYAKSQAAMQGFEIATDSAGKTIVRAMNEAADATRRAGRAADGAAGSYRNMEQSAEAAAAAAAVAAKYSAPKGGSVTGNTREERLAGQSATDESLRFELLAKLQQGTLTKEDLPALRAMVETIKTNQSIFDSMPVGLSSLSGLADDKKWAAARTGFEQAISTLGGGSGAGAATVGRRIVYDLRLNDQPYPIKLDEDDRESADNLDAFIARLTRDKRRAM
jgi:hypothetical protein